MILYSVDIMHICPYIYFTLLINMSNYDNRTDMMALKRGIDPSQRCRASFRFFNKLQRAGKKLL